MNRKSKEFEVANKMCIKKSYTGWPLVVKHHEGNQKPRKYRKG